MIACLCGCLSVRLTWHPPLDTETSSIEVAVSLRDDVEQSGQILGGDCSVVLTGTELYHLLAEHGYCDTIQ